ncbi:MULTISPECIES: RrF2 family transcriptional regulator [Acidobacteriaceae]|jgi:Rrf2 family protein|uniref:Rrf2 family protein n=1 Tax=Tunturiibacter gelidiferens TaxID=3069689 RepID=A0A9X0U309_9BACT|nr:MULTISPECIES: Rrf2 family transcriptional regulator [Acidobacteriaceae]MBB5327849.1 Rrf2 family protein [Edaphobacter lichenicola]
MATTSFQFSVAAHIMTALADHNDEHVNSAFLAESVNTEPTFVRKSLSKLVKAGLVVATRGKHGFCVLARPAAAITLADIYRASEAPATFAVHNYPVEKTCRTSSNIKKIMLDILPEAQNSFEQVLARTTLADMVQRVRLPGKQTRQAK